MCCKIVKYHIVCFLLAFNRFYVFPVFAPWSRETQFGSTVCVFSLDMAGKTNKLELEVY